MDFKSLLLKDKKFKKLVKNLDSPDYDISGLKGSSLSFFAANILEKAESNIVFFCLIITICSRCRKIC